MEMSVDQFEEATKANKKWKYNNERTSDRWRKVEATAMGSRMEKIESRVEKVAVMIVHVLSGLFSSNPKYFSQTYQLKSFRRICHK